MTRCPEKRPYPTRQAALAALVRSLRPGAYGRVYRCPHCGAWHITSQQRRRREAARAHRAAAVDDMPTE